MSRGQKGSEKFSFKKRYADMVQARMPQVDRLVRLPLDHCHDHQAPATRPESTDHRDLASEAPEIPSEAESRRRPPRASTPGKVQGYGPLPDK